jgi:hypothetical protein
MSAPKSRRTADNRTLPLLPREQSKGGTRGRPSTHAGRRTNKTAAPDVIGNRLFWLPGTKCFRPDFAEEAFWVDPEAVPPDYRISNLGSPGIKGRVVSGAPDGYFT